MRDNQWLQERLDAIWKTLYPDVEKKNKVSIKFQGRWKNKFGHIALKGKTSEIVINSLFKHPLVPEYIIDNTIAHELSHYFHGFNSPYKQKYKNPHKGGVVTKEMQSRGFKNIIKKENEFIKKHWYKLYEVLKNEKF